MRPCRRPAPRCGPARVPPSHIRIAIVGTGFSGLGALLALSDEGYGDELILLERRSDVGGTWHDNLDPGCRCDVPSNLYSFSFAPNPHWSDTFARQTEIERYLHDVVRRYGIRDKVAFDTTLEACGMGRRRRGLAHCDDAGLVDG